MSTTQDSVMMTERFTTLTRKGQITIPAEFRKALGLKEGDRISVVMDNGRVQISPSGSVVERTAGIFQSHEPPKSAEELRRLVEDLVAEEVIARMGE
jgi:AbrB family looped-hinge helix DNA binding protein